MGNAESIALLIAAGADLNLKCRGGVCVCACVRVCAHADVNLMCRGGVCVCVCARAHADVNLKCRGGVPPLLSNPTPPPLASFVTF